MYQRILVAVDESESSKRALDEALKLASRQTLAEPIAIHLLHVLDDALDLSELIAVGNVALAEAGAHVTAAGATASSLMVRSAGTSIASTILREAAAFSADLIVIGTHGLKGLRRAIVGSIAEEVIRDSPLPVLLPGRTINTR